MSIIFREEMTTFDSFAVSLHLLSGTLGLVTFSVFSVVSVEVIVGVVVVVVGGETGMNLGEQTGGRGREEWWLV